MDLQALFVFVLLTKASLVPWSLSRFEHNIFTRYFWIFFPPPNTGGFYTEYFYCYIGTAQTESRLIALLASGLIPSLHI